MLVYDDDDAAAEEEEEEEAEADPAFFKCRASAVASSRLGWPTDVCAAPKACSIASAPGCGYICGSEAAVVRSIAHIKPAPSVPGR